jgi:class 3 adenylate cyclase
VAKRNPLPQELEAVVERLAAEVHAAWVDHREEGGWHYGEHRDDHARESPSLVPYESLPESERELDRVTVRRTLQALRDLGYRVEHGAEPATESRAHLLVRVKHMIARGQPLVAYDLTTRWLATHPEDRDFTLHNAWALRRCGALHGALRMLEDMGEGFDPDGERRGLVAAVHKEMFIRSRQKAGSASLDHLRMAQTLYHEVFDESGGKKYWHGINAATLAALQGREELAREIAARVWNACMANGSSSSDYWSVATRGEAALLRRQFDVAAAEYRSAVKLAGSRTGDIAATRHNAMLLLDAYSVAGADRRAIEDALQPPAVVVFAGPQLVGGGVADASFSPEVERNIRAALDERLQSLKAGFGFSGAAPGAETLFLEAMLDRDPGVVTVVLPWPREQFVATHVRTAGEPWLQRFDRLLGDGASDARVQNLVQASLGVGIDSPLYERFAQLLLLGLGRLLAETLTIDVVPLVVRSGARSAGRRDDLSALVDTWEARGVRFGLDNVIDIGPPLPRHGPGRSVGTKASDEAAALPERGSRPPFRVMSILFADVENYSRITERELPLFIEHFVGGIGDALNDKPYKAANVRRVGDGLLMMFTSLRDAGLCALELVEWVSVRSQPGADGETHWSRVGLPRELRVRVALHAGPVFECVDPLTRTAAFEGAHMNYAARIEPVTPGNQVYASEAFAALAAAEPATADEFVCEYVGRTSLAKKFGEYPLYSVRRR